jgi:glycosyltransferase involved in cell wall biosynthesis
MDDKYSVLMSVYKNDNKDYVDTAIESMLSQTVQPEQFVIVIDGEIPDEIQKVINHYQDTYKGVFTIVRQLVNQGLGKSLDEGMKHCRNELIARMDADDISLPNRCEKELEMFHTYNKLAICGSNIDEFYDNPDEVQSIRRVPSDYESIVRFIKRRQPFNHPTVMYKKSEVIRCGGYGQLRRKQDYDLFSRMINMGCYARNIDESLLKFRADKDNYKRRKSWSYVKSSIKVGALNFKRGYCGLIDLMYIVCGQVALYIMPINLMKIVSDNLLREKA